MRIAIVGPAPEEINPFKSKINVVKKEEKFGLEILVGKYKDIDVVVSECGLCKVNAAIMTQYLIDNYDVSRFIVIGAAGAIDESLNIADIVIPTQIIHHDLNEGILIRNHPYLKNEYFELDKDMLELCKNISGNIYYGKLVTGEMFIDDNGREEIIKRFDPLAVDMETASIAQTCYVNGINLFVIRSITDTPSQRGITVFEENLEKAVKSATDYLIKFLDKMN